MVSTNNCKVFCITKTLVKNVLLEIEECKIQIDGYNDIKIQVILIATEVLLKRYLNVRSYFMKENDFQEQACGKIEMNVKTSLYILSLCRSVNRSIDPQLLLDWWKVTDTRVL